MGDKSLRITFHNLAKSEVVMSFYMPSLTAEQAAKLLQTAEFDLAIIEDSQTVTEVEW